jgi:hypothetical protein
MANKDSEYTDDFGRMARFFKQRHAENSTQGDAELSKCCDIADYFN